MSRRADELRDLLAATTESKRRRYLQACGLRTLERYEERYGAPIADREIFDAALTSGPQEETRLGHQRALLAYADTVPHEPAALIARALAAAIVTSTESWRLAMLLPEVSATPPVDRAWARLHLLEIFESKPDVEPPAPPKPFDPDTYNPNRPMGLRYGAPPPPDGWARR